MKTKEFFYNLDEKLIAQSPIESRDDSRLMILNKSTGKIRHEKFFNIIEELKNGDLLILNNSKVLPARIYGLKEKTESKIEFLLLKANEKDIWEVLAKPGKKAKINNKFIFQEGLQAEVINITQEGNRIIKFFYKDNFYNILNKIGQMPLPPYIKEKLKEKSRYQTVYAEKLGSAAAPTAGLHFTSELLKKIKERNINIGFVTLHVGLGTFRPVKTEDIKDHKMHSEYYFLPEETANLINNTRKNGGRIIAVGTTSCRVLESVACNNNQKEIKPSQGFTDIFIFPGYKFKITQGLITNFHLPESTLIMLVSAFAGKENILKAYETAVQEKYRFFSFGDAMLII